MDFSKISKIAFKIGKIEITKYAIMIILGMIIGVLIVSYLLKNRGVSIEFTLTAFIYAIPLGIIFARLGYVIPRLGTEYKTFIDIINIRQGGLTIVTGALGGLFGIIIASLIHKKSPFRILDISALGLLLAQSIGRWGNFFNGELYGAVVKDDVLKRFPLAVKVEADNFTQWHYSLFLYEGVLNMMAFAIILLFVVIYIPKIKNDDLAIKITRNKDIDLSMLYEDKLKPGVVAFIYISWYCFVRAILETLKDPSNKVYSINGVKLIQLICAIVCPLSAIIALLIQVKVIKTESKKLKLKHFAFDVDKILEKYRIGSNHPEMLIKDEIEV